MKAVNFYEKEEINETLLSSSLKKKEKNQNKSNIAICTLKFIYSDRVLSREKAITTAYETDMASCAN